MHTVILSYDRYFTADRKELMIYVNTKSLYQISETLNEIYREMNQICDEIEEIGHEVKDDIYQKETALVYQNIHNIQVNELMVQMESLHKCEVVLKNISGIYDLCEERICEAADDIHNTFPSVSCDIITLKQFCQLWSDLNN